MELEVWRYNSDSDSTLGQLMLRGDTWERLCDTCEDGPAQRIPAGRYQILFREHSPMAERYARDFPVTRERGMLWLQGVPGFTWSHIHAGDDEDDTLGCLLLGEHSNQIARNIQQSRSAFGRVYPRIADEIAAGRPQVWITYRDLDYAQLPVPIH